MSARGKRPAHQNKTAFQHNPNSRLTARIAAIPNDGLCHRCHAIIEWRKKYRKYKPLTNPRKCNQCAQKTVRFAYHTLCAPCSGAKRVCAKCGESRELVEKAETPLGGEELVRWMGDMGVRERRRRLVMRQWESGERTDEEIREMVKKYAAEAASRDGLDDDDDDDWEEEDDEDDMDEEKEAEERAADEKSDKKQPTSTTATLPSPASTAASTAARPSSSTATATPTRGVDKLTLLRSSKGVAQGGGADKGGGRAAAKQAVSDDDDEFDDDEFD